MTVSYSLDVSKTRLCGFTKLLGRWKGGIYKILWREFLIFCAAYVVLSATYRSYLSEEQKLIFEKVVIFVETYTDAIPLSFVLGFYVSLVISRWWGQYVTIPWPDRLCFLIASYVHGSDERSRMIRRTLGRYVILAQALTFQAVSTSVKRRFPTTQHLVDAGIMTKEEKSVYDKISFMHGKWWLPCHWFSALATRARKEGRIKDSVLLNGLFSEILEYRTSCAIMFGYDWISVPLVYTQVVTIATYMYSVALLVGRQYLDPSKGYASHDIDLYIPFFTLLQFFFYMGWLKVAEQILNPYGEDDDDFELNWCLDRTVHIVYLVVDSLQLKHPRISKDMFWDEMDPVLPQTRQSANFSIQPQLGSANSLHIEEAEYIPLEALLEHDLEENIYKSDSVKRRDEMRPSLIRRLLSSGFGRHSRRGNLLSKENSANNTSQGFSNPAFERNNEKNLVSVHNTSSVSPTSSLNNAVKISPSHSRTSSVSFRPNSLALHRRKTYHLQDAQKAYHSPNSPTERSSSSNVIPVTRTISAPQFINNGSSQPSQQMDIIEDDYLETDLDEQRLMASIPEETSRATSLASIEAGSLKTLRSPLKRLEDVHSLVQEANKVLQELHRSVSVDGLGKDSGRTGYESCCSKSDSDSSSDEVEIEPKDTEEEECNETTVVIDIDREAEPDSHVRNMALTPNVPISAVPKVDSSTIVSGVLYSSVSDIHNSAVPDISGSPLSDISGSALYNVSGSAVTDISDSAVLDISGSAVSNIQLSSDSYVDVESSSVQSFSIPFVQVSAVTDIYDSIGSDVYDSTVPVVRGSSVSEISGYVDPQVQSSPVLDVQDLSVSNIQSPLFPEDQGPTDLNIRGSSVPDVHS